MTTKITGRSGLMLTMREQNALWLFHHNAHVLLKESLKLSVSMKCLNEQLKVTDAQFRDEIVEFVYIFVNNKPLSISHFSNA